MIVAPWQRVAMALAMAGLCGAAWAAPATQPSTAQTAASRPVAGASPRTQPASPASAVATKPASAAAPGEENAPLPREVLLKARESFVILEIWYKKDTSETLRPTDSDYQLRRIYEDFVDQKRPDERSALVLDDRGHVLMGDDGLEDRFLDKIVVRDMQGNRHSARRSRLLFDAPGVILQVDGNAAGRLRPLDFVPLEKDDWDGTFYQIRHFQSDDEWHVGAAPLTPNVRYAPDDRNNVYFGYHPGERYGRRYPGGEPLVIITRQDGGALGCGLAPFLDLQQKEVLWKGPDLIPAEGVDWAALRQKEEAVRQSLIQAAQEVVIRLRGGEEDEYGRQRSGASGREVSVYGVALNDTDVLVPRTMTSDLAGQIDKIFLKFSATSRAEAQFVGAFQDFGAFVVRLAKGKLPAAVRLADQAPPRMKPLWEVRIRKRFGDKYADLVTNRLYGRTQGYKGEYYWYPAREMYAGSLLVDLDGRVVGFYLTERTEHEEEQQLETSGRSERRVRVFTIREVQQALAKIQDHLDPKIVVKSASAAKRRAWLGVEFVPMNSDLAEQFKVEKPTKDGQLGFVVNAVYDHSPAAKLGLQVGDILLKLQTPDMPYPIELPSRMARQEDSSYRGRYFGRGDDEEGPPAPSWKNRSNFLTRAFDAIGVGKPVRIIYYRPDPNGGEGKEVSFNYQIEQAPPDVDSARKWINRKLGLTVKDLTYEIRHALSLKDDDPGVLVAKVEDGSPMTVARIYPNEIIVRLDDQPLSSARQMRDLIAKAAAAGRAKVRLTILRMGKTRFADLAITEYDPADDEGLEED